MIYINLQTLEYPVSPAAIREAHPNTSFPEDLSLIDLTEFGFSKVNQAATPAFNPMSERLAEGAPELIDGEYFQTWVIEQLPVEQCLFNAQMIVQNHLDQKARERNYDGLLSACTYASSSVPKFAAEGQACVEWRDSVWATCYQVMSDVQSSDLPMPTPEELIALLPELVWPS